MLDTLNYTALVRLLPRSTEPAEEPVSCEQMQGAYADRNPALLPQLVLLDSLNFSLFVGA